MKQILGLLILTGLVVSPAWALREMLGPGPLSDGGVPQGSMLVMNHPSRASGYAGPGHGQVVLEYRGNEATLQEVVNLFAAIRWPVNRIVVRDEKYSESVQKERVDWTLEVWSASEWPMQVKILKAVGLEKEFGTEYPGPKLTVYAPAQGINWDQIKVPDGVNVSDLRSLAKPGGVTWKGQIFDSTSAKPVAARVAFERRRETTWDALAAGQSTDDGRLDQGQLPPGSYRLNVEAAGYVRTILNVEIPTTGAEQTILLSPALTISGIVVDTDDKPIQGISVRITDITGPGGKTYPSTEQRTSTTDDRGVFTFANLPAGTARFRVSSGGWYGLDPLKQWDLDSGGREKVTLRVTATGTVKGILMKADGTPAGLGNISIFPPGEQVGKWGGGKRVGQDGSFEFTDVPPGVYFLSGRYSSPDMGEDPNAVKIEVKPRETTEARVKM